MTEQNAHEHSFVRYSIPGLPYSHVEVPVDRFYRDDGDVTHERTDAQMAERAIKMLTHLAMLAEKAFPVDDAKPEGGHLVAAAQANGAQRQQGAPQGGSQPHPYYGNCPEHPNVRAIPSAPQYQQYDVDAETGNQIPAKFFCPGKENGTGKNHSLWRSKLVIPQGTPVGAIARGEQWTGGEAAPEEWIGGDDAPPRNDDEIPF